MWPGSSKQWAMNVARTIVFTSVSANISWTRLISSFEKITSLWKHQGDSSESCQTSGSNQYSRIFFIQVTKASLLRRRAGMFQSYLDLLGPLRDSVCNRKEKKVCCLSSSSTLPKLAREEKALECQVNPCSGEPTPSIPWPDKEGCFPLPARPSSCNLVLNGIEDRLECEPADSLGVRGVAVPAGR